jgi:hypothetical protein
VLSTTRSLLPVPWKAMTVPEMEDGVMTVLCAISPATVPDEPTRIWAVLAAAWQPSSRFPIARE